MWINSLNLTTTYKIGTIPILSDENTDTERFRKQPKVTQHGPDSLALPGAVKEPTTTPPCCCSGGHRRVFLAQGSSSSSHQGLMLVKPPLIKPFLRSTQMLTDTKILTVEGLLLALLRTGHAGVLSRDRSGHHLDVLSLRGVLEMG